MLCVLGNIPEIPLESSTGNTIDERDVTSCVCGSLKNLSFSLAWSFHRLFSLLCDPWSSLEGSAAPDGMCEGGSESEIRCDRHSVVEALRSVQMSVWYGRSDACWRNTIRRPLTVSHCLCSSSFICRLAWHTTELTPILSGCASSFDSFIAVMLRLTWCFAGLFCGSVEMNVRWLYSISSIRHANTNWAEKSLIKQFNHSCAVLLTVRLSVTVAVMKRHPSSRHETEVAICFSWMGNSSEKKVWYCQSGTGKRWDIVMRGR